MAWAIGAGDIPWGEHLFVNPLRYVRDRNYRLQLHQSWRALGATTLAGEVLLTLFGILVLLIFIFFVGFYWYTAYRLIRYHEAPDWSMFLSSC